MCQHRFFLSSSSSSDEGSVSVPDRSPPEQVVDYNAISPSDDVVSVTDLMMRMAKALELEMEQPEVPARDKVFGKQPVKTPPTTALPPLQTLLDVVQKLWENPFSVSPSTRKLDNLYRVVETNAQWLAQHPKANSVVVDAAQTGSSQKQHATPADKDGKKMDAMGRKAYSIGALLFRIANYTACMGAYQQFLWEHLAPYLDRLPAADKDLAYVLQREGLTLSSQQISSAKHLTECSARSVAGAVSLRRFAWLKSSTLSLQSKSTIEDLPFDGVGLFHADTDLKLKHNHEMRDTIKKCGFESSQQSKPFKQRFFSWNKQRSTYRRSYSPSARKGKQSSFPNQKKFSGGQKQQHQRFRQSPSGPAKRRF